jgi:hypothetical protein
MAVRFHKITTLWGMTILRGPRRRGNTHYLAVIDVIES